MKRVEITELNEAMTIENINLSKKLGFSDINKTQMILFDIFYAYVTDSNLEMFKKFIKGKYENRKRFSNPENPKGFSRYKK